MINILQYEYVCNILEENENGKAKYNLQPKMSIGGNKSRPSFFNQSARRSQHRLILLSLFAWFS